MSSSPMPAGAIPRERSRRAAWLREPLLHFLILGALLFAADHLLSADRDDPMTIIVGAAVDREARETFAAARGREPTAEELTALRQVWLDNEVLFREGMALGMDRGDTAIRDRIVFKALSMVDANVKRPPITDETLRAWFEKNRTRYDEPARYDFQEAALVGENGESEVRAFVAALNAGTPGDAKAGLRVFKGRPHSNLVLSYGEAFAVDLEQGTSGEWRAMRTREGWRAIRLDTVTPPKPASFEALRPVVIQDWTDAVMAERRTAGVRALASKYRIRHEVPQ
ncbi:MAG: peptidylprolyl isomerase [Burkholderiales bacterium]